MSRNVNDALLQRLTGARWADIHGVLLGTVGEPDPARVIRSRTKEGGGFEAGVVTATTSTLKGYPAMVSKPRPA